MKKTTVTLLAGLLIGSTGGYLLSTWNDATTDPDSAEPKPLYWVAPMDPDYRRDKPGKSPMGMDLVPVYEEEGSALSKTPGTITIDPNVVNNLGVRTSRVTLGALESEITTVGYVQYDEDRLVHIHPRVEGWIEKLYVNATGDPVVEGQPMYALYSPQLVNSQEEYILALRANNPRLIQAARDRLRALDIDEATIQQLDKSRSVQTAMIFYAPQTGIVDNLNVREGFYVKPGTMVMSIGVLDSIWVEAEVFERQASMVEVGLAVSMTLDYVPGRVWQGSVDYVYPVLDPKTRTARVRLRFDNPEGVLKPNMFAQVTIHAEPAEALLVPKEAVIRTGSQDRVVLALGGGSYKSIAVTLGRQDKHFVEVLEGVNEADTVVTSAQFLLDSESSKTSDFVRMQHSMTTDEKPVETASARGVINHIDSENRILNISRGPIKKWNRPAATMDFNAASAIDLKQLSSGQEVHFRFKIEKGDFIVIEVHPISGGSGHD